jgi:hypothetical protein
VQDIRTIKRSIIEETADKHRLDKTGTIQSKMAGFYFEGCELYEILTFME